MWSINTLSFPFFPSFILNIFYLTISFWQTEVPGGLYELLYKDQILQTAFFCFNPFFEYGNWLFLYCNKNDIIESKTTEIIYSILNGTEDNINTK